MKRLQVIESKGYKVTVFMSGNGAQAVKGNTTITGTSISNLHFKIFGY